MAEKVTTMVLSVDLKCPKCYKWVKKLLCKFPEIRDQTYDEKENKVTIKVVSSSPERIRDKLLCKGRGCIKGIEIKDPEKPKPAPQPSPPKVDLALKICCKGCGDCRKGCGDCSKGCGDCCKGCGDCCKGCGDCSKGCGDCCKGCGDCCKGCGDCCKGRHGGSSFCCERVQYDRYCGKPVCNSWGGYPSGCGSRCDYFCEEKPQGCSTM